MKLLDCRKAMGQAVWLFLLYGNNAREASDHAWAPVSRGQPIRDSQAADVLKAPIHTVIRWRRRLQEAGVIRTEVCRGGGLKVWVRHTDPRSGDLAASATQAQRWPVMQTEIVQ